MTAKFRNRIEDFKDAVQHAAVSETKVATLLAKFIIHAPRQRSHFTTAAYKTLESIGALEQYMLKHQKDYVDRHRTTKHERDSIEQEVLICRERLHSVTSRYDQLRSIHFQYTFSRATPRRRLNRIPKKKKDSEDTSSSNNLEAREPEAFQTQCLMVQQQLFGDETRALQVELTSLLDAVQETGTKMVEMSALNHLMSTHVLHQREQIEQLYKKAVEASDYVDLGNKELFKAIQRNTSSRTLLLLFLFVLTFSILFLDWYS